MNVLSGKCQGRSRENRTMASITTIIPTYRRPHLLKRAVRSVLAQSYRDFQVCIYDNASGDETREVVEELARHDGRVKYYCHDRNIGMLPNYVFGLNRVETPFFNMMGDDDVLLPGFFKTAAAALENNPEAKWFIGLLLSVFPNGKIEHIHLPAPRDAVLSARENFLRMTRFWQTWTSMMFRTEILATAGGLDPEVGPPSDIDFEMRVAALHPAAVSPEPCAFYYDHPGAESNANVTLNIARALDRIVKNVTNVGGGGKVDDAMRRSFITLMRKWLFWNAVRDGVNGRIEVPRESSEVFTRVLGAQAHAAVLLLIGTDSAAGAAGRAALLAVRAALRAMREVRRWGTGHGAPDPRIVAVARLASMPDPDWATIAGQFEYQLAENA